MHFKNLEGKREGENPKRKISVSGGPELLQMVSEPDTGRCVNEEVEPRKGWIRGGMSARTLGPERGWIMISHIGW